MPPISYDAVVVGSGPNGFGAAITLQKSGLSVLLIEGKEVVGGGLRSSELTLPGFVHDICSAIHPMAATSPLFTSLPLQEHGLEYLYPDISTAHPFDNGTAAFLNHSLEDTSHALGADRKAYLNLIQPLVKNWPLISQDVLGPLKVPSHPLMMAQFGLNAIPPVGYISKNFSTEKAKGLWAGMAAHSILPFTHLTSSAIGLVLMAAGHLGGWPLPKGGSQAIAKALASYFKSIGGHIETGRYVTDLNDLPGSKAVLLDVTPRQLLKIAGKNLSTFYKWQLAKYRYGMGVFKVDWALSEPVPFTSTECRLAGTLHLGNTFSEIAATEQLTWEGKHPDKPFVLLAQQSLIDPTRAPKGKHTLWGYCHVPHGSTVDRTTVIENQIERFAPGFKDTILARHTMNTTQMEWHNPNYIGGDINGGVIDIGQLFTRPVISSSPYRTSGKGIYICSSSTPPGGGVHGMCGYHAARQALKDIFNISPAGFK